MNAALLKTLTHEKLLELGFTYECDDSGSPLGCDWNYRTEKFHIVVDSGFEVKLYRLDTDTDLIKIEINDIFELEMLIEWTK